MRTDAPTSEAIECHRRMARAAGAAIVPLALLLAACSTPGGPGTASTIGADESRSARPTDSARRGGGYYLDDGPAANAPADLASIPDAVPRAEPLLARTMRPYSVLGRRYAPMSALAPYRQRGVASWYGRRYHGRPTSSGEHYDMFAMTAAHPTLPIPSYVRVTHLVNRRSVVVRVNDRGPFLQNRLIDLSYTAAAKLGFVEAGSADVEVELITQFDSPATAVAQAAPASPALDAVATDRPGSSSAIVAEPLRLDVETTVAGNEASPHGGIAPMSPAGAGEPAPSAAHASASASMTQAAARPATLPPTDSGPAASDAGARGFWVQLGAFGSLESAQSALSRFASELDWLRARFDLRREGAFYKVQAGPWTRREHALQAAERVRAATALRPFTTFR